MTTTSASLAVATLTAAGQDYSVPALSPADEAGVLAFVRNWDDAWIGHNAHALAALHTEDAVTVNRFGTLLRGRNATGIALSFLHENSGPFGQSEFPPQQVLIARQILPEIVIVQTKWQCPKIDEHGHAHPHAVDEMIVSFVLVKRGTEWQATEVNLQNVEKLNMPFANPTQR